MPTNNSAARKQVLDRLDTCGPGQIRNPRTDRCVRRDKPLGRALHAAAQALRAGAPKMPACPKGGEAYDPAARACTADRYRAPALRELLTRYAWAEAANRGGAGNSGANSAAVARLITSQALAKAAAANDRRHNAANRARKEASLREAGGMFNQLAAYSEGLRSQGDSNAQTILRLQAALGEAARELDRTRRDLDSSRQKVKMLERALASAERGNR